MESIIYNETNSVEQHVQHLVFFEWWWQWCWKWQLTKPTFFFISLQKYTGFPLSAVLHSSHLELVSYTLFRFVLLVQQLGHPQKVHFPLIFPLTDWCWHQVSCSCLLARRLGFRIAAPSHVRPALAVLPFAPLRSFRTDPGFHFFVKSMVTVFVRALLS